jgi:4'-phosphopantetheinyl transferase
MFEPGVYGININTVMPDERRIDTMPPERARDIRAFRHPDDRRRAFVAGLLLEAVLGREAAASVRRREGGKPYVEGGPCFSLSHSGDWAAVAVSQTDTGFDIERFNAGRDTGLVVRRALGPEEAEAASGNLKAFYRIWTAKESYLKMLGGRTGGLAGVRVRLEGETARVKGDGEVLIRFFDQFEGYAAALCSPAGIVWPREISVLSGI